MYDSSNNRICCISKFLIPIKNSSLYIKFWHWIFYELKFQDPAFNSSHKTLLSNECFSNSCKRHTENTENFVSTIQSHLHHSFSCRWALTVFSCEIVHLVYLHLFLLHFYTGLWPANYFLMYSKIPLFLAYVCSC